MNTEIDEHSFIAFQNLNLWQNCLQKIRTKHKLLRHKRRILHNSESIILKVKQGNDFMLKNEYCPPESIAMFLSI